MIGYYILVGVAHVPCYDVDNWLVGVAEVLTLGNYDVGD